MNKLDNELKIVALIFRDFLTEYNSRNLSKKLGISHAGSFKIAKKLEREKILKSRRIGNVVVYSLELENPVANKMIEMALIIEAQNHKRWLEEFKELKDSYFTVLFGSILRDEKNAKDIDLLVVADKEKFKSIKKIIGDKNKLSLKKIHLIFQTIEDFKKDLNDKNKVTLNIVKTGIVLYGQENFREILR